MNMIYHVKNILALMLMLVSSVSFAGQNIINVQSSKPEFTIKLPANPTTGFSWSLKYYDNKLITLVGHSYVKPNTNQMGTPGYEYWTFTANPNFFNTFKKTKISLLYARPWEPTVDSKKAVFWIKPSKN